MAEYNDDFTPSYNMFVEQNKQYKDLISPQEWNQIVNTLSLQADSTAEQVYKIHQYLVSGAVGELYVSVEDNPDIKQDLYIKIET